MIYDYPYHRNYYNMYRKNNYLNNNTTANNPNTNNSENLINSVKETRTISDDTIIDIFGIKFAFDDLIILGLLYLLYIEDVKDISLYLVLILLLLN